MIDSPFHPRFVLPRLTEALADTPVVLIHGPRQCGKTTLARAVGDATGYAYVSFDSDVLRASAQADPMGFVADLPDKAVLDEVQRVPELLAALKAVVDRDRRPGRFILTGSANVLLLPMAVKLGAIASEEQLTRQMILEGVLSIQAGDNPRIVREKLQSFLPPAERPAEEEEPAAAPPSGRGRSAA